MIRKASPSFAPQSLHFQQGTYEQVLKLIPEDRSARILDVGAGEGYFCRQLRDLGYRAEACDFTLDQFKCDDVPFMQVDLSRQPIPVPDNSYDSVVSIEVAEHVENHFRFIRELIRVTKPGGRIIITTPNVSSFSSRWHFFLYGYTDCAPYPLDPTREEYLMEHINPISVSELLFAFERFGADMDVLTTNRIRRGCWLPMLALYPFLALAMRRKFLRRKDAEFHELRRRHLRWVLHPANLMGRITIAAAKKRVKQPSVEPEAGLLEEPRVYVEENAKADLYGLLEDEPYRVA